ncbi:MAG: phasin family protein [Paracoccaceae bacterium]
MTEKAKNPTRKETTAPEFTAMTDALTELQKAGLGSLSWMGTAWLENMSDLSSEVMSFIADRVKEDVRTQHQILHCNDVSRLQKIQAEFIQRAIDQYTAETGRLVAMGNTFLKDVQAREPTKD